MDVQNYESVDDILYGILNVLARQKITVSNAECTIYAFCPTMIVESLQQGMQKIQELHSVAINQRVKPFL